MPVICQHCNKEFSSQSSRSNHNKKFHKSDISQKSVSHQPNISRKAPALKCKEISYPCSFCDKEYKHIQSRWKHENKCKINENNKVNSENIMKEQIENLIDTVNTLKKELNKKNEAKTVNNNNNNGTIINNNIHINELGRENILNKLTLEEQINIATCHLFNESPHVEMVRLTYTKENCLENQNTLITNLQNKSCQVFNSKSKKYEATNKSQHIDNIIHYRKKDIKELSETLKQNEKVYKKYGNKLEPVEPNDPAKDKEEITYIIYNKRGQVMQLKKQVESMDNIEIEDEEDEEIEEPEVKNIIV